MNITLESFMLEQSINEVDVMDIYVEQAQAELNVALALLSANLKDITYQEAMISEGYVQEGELGDSVGTAVSGVRADGKKHYIKTALAAVKAFFKFLVTKVGSFFKKTETDASATLTTFKQLAAKVSAEYGEEFDVKLPYKKDNFIKIYQFYEKAGSELENICNIADGLVDKVINNQTKLTIDYNNATGKTSTHMKNANGQLGKKLSNSDIFGKDIASLRNFIELCKKVDTITKEPDEIDYKAELKKGNLSKEVRQAAKRAYKNGELAKEAEKNATTDNSMPTIESAPEYDKIMLRKKSDETCIWIGLQDFNEFVSVVSKVKAVWAQREKGIKGDIKVIDDVAKTLSQQANENSDASAAVMRTISSFITELQKGVNGLITPAQNILNSVRKWKTAVPPHLYSINTGKAGSWIEDENGHLINPEREARAKKLSTENQQKAVLNDKHERVTLGSKVKNLIHR